MHPAPVARILPVGDPDWVSATEFAAMAGLTRQAAWKALKACRAGQVWRGVALQVRTVAGRGGRAGLCYQVSLSSLSEALEAELSDPFDFTDPSPEMRRTAGDQGAAVAERFAVIEAALAYPPKSRACTAAIRAAAKTGHSERSILRWLTLYRAHGLSGLARKKPANAGNRRVIVSRTFDTAFLAAGYELEMLAQIGAQLEPQIAGLWASQAEASGATTIERMASFLLWEMCEAESVALPPAAYRLSRRCVERFAKYRVVNQYKNDRKAFDDAKPRVKRSWTAYAPMEIVTADVKPLDVAVQRSDGSVAYPRLIGFMDNGTGRIFGYPVLCERGEGIRQEHVFEAFIAMTQEPGWGFPQGLYLDNGSEFSGFEKIRAALELIGGDDVRTIIYAKPYNGSAKPIEGLFARLDRQLICHFPGYAGSDRMRSKTQNVGKPPEPFKGPWAEFCDLLAAGLKVFNRTPVGGQWAGRSADDWLQMKVDAGWRPAQVAPSTLDAAFCDFETRLVLKGVLSIGGETYHHPVLSGLPSRTKVTIARPWRRGADPLFRDPHGSWAYLERELALPAMWPEGAKESARRQLSHVRAIKALAAEAPQIDPLAITRRMAQQVPAGRIEGRGDLLDTGAELSSVAGAIAARPAEEGARATEEARRRRATERETARLEKLYANG